MYLYVTLTVCSVAVSCVNAGTGVPMYSSVPNNCAPVPNNRAVVFWLFLLFYCTYKSKSCPSLSLDQDLSSEWLRAPLVHYMKEKITLHYYYQPAQLLGTLEYARVNAYILRINRFINFDLRWKFFMHCGYICACYICLFWSLGSIINF